MKLLVVGTGYVGLVTGACFAEMGHDVICLDIDEKKIENLKKGEIPFYEPGISELVYRNQKDKRLHFTTDYKWGVENSLICFIAVPTPSKEDGSCNFDFVLSAADSLAAHMDGYRIIVNKSTVPIGSSERVEERIREGLKKRGKAHSFDIVSNPEFLKEGAALQDCMKPERIIIGVKSARARCAMEEIYSPFSLNRNRIFFMDIRSAEMAKYASNAMLALRISFMNELSGLCERLGADISQVRRGVGSDSRIGPHFLYAGVGFGGSCFPKDVRALLKMGEEVGYDMSILRSVVSINERQKQVLHQKMVRHFSTRGGLQGKTIAIWGLAFKPNTDDMREAPALELIHNLLQDGACVRLYDPIAMNVAKGVLKDHPGITWCSDEYDAAKGAHAIALVTEWKQFRFVDFERVVGHLLEKSLFDGRNQYKRIEMQQKGFVYHGIGIPEKEPVSLS